MQVKISKPIPTHSISPHGSTSIGPPSVRVGTKHEDQFLVQTFIGKQRLVILAMQNGHHLAEPARKRLRTSHACDLCRGRKIRCDGNNPCAACVAADNVCTYGSEANSRGKSELILESVMRLERSLHDIQASISLIAPRSNYQPRQSVLPPINISYPPRASFSESPLAEQLHHRAPIPSPYQQRRTSQTEPETTDAENLENAVLETWHTSTTEAVLNWTHFHAFPSLRDDYIPIFQLEQSRAPIALRPNSTIFPYLTPNEIDHILESFSQNINFWYPTTSLDQIRNTRRMILSGSAEILETPSPDSVLALLIMALGCASQMCSGLYPYRPPHLASCASDHARPHGLATIFFSLALSRIYIAHTNPSSTSTHCLFFTAMYFAYLRRPLQAWEYISSAASKCMLFLSYPLTSSANNGDMERIRRIFWACYILESDYLAELSSLPLSGIARIESSVSLPGATPGIEYKTQEDETENDRSSCYFSACISMRRLLNRVHQLLYARDVGAGNDRARFPFVVAELGAQLEEWRDVLPSVFKFEVAPLGKGIDHTRDDNSLNSGSRISDMLTSADEETREEAQKLENSRRGFLRQRYLTCRSVIYRPYLMWILNGGTTSMLVETSTPLPSIPSPISARGAPHSLSSPVPTTPSDVSGNAREHQGQDMLRHTKACLDACLLHILNLRGFAQTVMVDTWICSLSMAGAMLVLLAAIRIPSLRGLIGPEVLAAGGHLRGLLEDWQRLLGDPRSPSVDQSIRIISEADRFIKEVYNHHPSNGTSIENQHQAHADDPLKPRLEGREA